MTAEAVIAEAIRYRPHARIPCPFCSEGRRKSTDPSMSVDESDGAALYKCWHCDAQGIVRPQHEKETRPTMSAVVRSILDDIAPQHRAHAQVQPPLPHTIGPLEEDALQFLSSRGISQATAEAAGIGKTTKFFAKLQRSEVCVAIPYRDATGRVMAHKYRSYPEKSFTQDQGGVHQFFGLELVQPGKPLVIVEGEFDQLSLREAGVENALSVPNGAPLSITDGKQDASEDKRLRCVAEASELLASADAVILATDADGPGNALREELARRIGKHKCWVVTFPEGCKDANDVLLKHGKKKLCEIIDQAQPFPINGLYSAADYEAEVEALYNTRSGRGLLTGLNAIDEFYSIAPGQLTVVTGVPSSGKSNLIDQICINLARTYSWKTVYCSFENPPAVHIARLCEIKTGLPFFEHRENSFRMSAEHMKQAREWVNRHFSFIEFRDTEPPTIDAILQRVQAAILRMGVRGVVIDPYNFVRMGRKGTETDEISDMLSKVQAFCKANDIHAWFIAHPRKMYQGENGEEARRPDGHHVHGSAAWWAKADCGLTVHRGKGTDVHVDVWKVRHRWIGRQGSCMINYDPLAGTYHDA